jgi:hypothetical protein
MKKIIAALCLSVVVFPAYAQNSCDDLKAEIAKKIESKGVKNYQLEIINAADVKDQKVVGSCENGKKKLVYKKA